MLLSIIPKLIVAGGGDSNNAGCDSAMTNGQQSGNDKVKITHQS